MSIPDNASQLQPPLQPPLQPRLVAEASQDSLCMSNFIDFEPEEREGEHGRMIGPQMLSSTANRLRRMAMEEVRPLAATFDIAQY